MNIAKSFLLAGTAMLLIVGLNACDKQDPAKTSEGSIDQATEKVGDKMDEGLVRPGAMDAVSAQPSEPGDMDAASTQPGEPGEMDAAFTQPGEPGDTNAAFTPPGEPGDTNAAFTPPGEQGDVDAASLRLAEVDNKAIAGFDDIAIAAEVKATILTDPDLEDLQINVDTTKGVTTLSGSADSQQSSARAEELAGTVEGVERVENQLVIKPIR